MSTAVKKQIVHYGICVDDQESFGRGCMKLILKQYSPSPYLSHFFSIFKSYFNAILIEYIIVEHGNSMVTVKFEVIDPQSPQTPQMLSTSVFNVDAECKLTEQVNAVLAELGNLIAAIPNSMISKVEVIMVPNETRSEIWQKADYKMDTNDANSVRSVAAQLDRQAFAHQALECAEFLRLNFLNGETLMSTLVADYIHRIEEGSGWRGDGKYLDLLIVACVAITHRRGSAMNLISSYMQNNTPLRSNSTLHKHYERLLKKGQIPDSILIV